MSNLPYWYGLVTGLAVGAFFISLKECNGWTVFWLVMATINITVDASKAGVFNG